MSSLHEGQATLLGIVPVLTDVAKAMQWQRPNPPWVSLIQLVLLRPSLTCVGCTRVYHDVTGQMPTPTESAIECTETCCSKVSKAVHTRCVHICVMYAYMLMLQLTDAILQVTFVC